MEGGSVSKREDEVVALYLVIEDRHERLNAILHHKQASLELIESEKIEANLVRGCASQVWIKSEVVSERLKIRFAAESALVRGLVSLVAAIYDGAELGDAAAYTPTLLTRLGLDRMLSPTRLNGLAHVLQKIQTAAKGGNQLLQESEYLQK